MKMPKNKCLINEKRKRFVDEYLVDLNATQAAIRAGYAPKTAAQIGYELVHNGSVSAAIAREKAARSRRTGIIADRVLRELARVAFVDPAKIINFETAEVLPDVTDDDRSVISGIKVKIMISETGNMTEREVKFCDKLKALDMLAKHLGLYDGVNGGKDGDDEKTQTGVVLLPPVQPLTPPTDDETAKEEMVDS